MADPIEEILKYRISAGKEAQRDLASASQTLAQIRVQLEALQRIKLPTPAQINQINTLLTRQQNWGNYASSLQPDINAGQRAAQQLQQHQAPRGTASPTRQLMPQDLQDLLGGQEAALDEYTKRLKRARSPKSITKWETKLEQGQREYDDLLDQLYRIPFENVNKVLQKAVTDAKKSGTPMSLPEYASLKRELAAGQLVNEATDPQLARAYRMATGTPMQRFGGWIGNNLKDPQNRWAMGYAALQLGSEVGDLGATYMDGRRYSQEARTRQWAGILPGALGLAGSAFGPVGSMAGSAIGAVGSAWIGAASERHESIRMASEAISAEMGRGAGAARGFADAINDAANRLGTPAAELADAVRSIAGSVSGFTTGGIRAQAQLQGQLGDLYPQALAAQLQHAGSTPFGLTYRNALATGNADANTYFGAALVEAARGNRQGAYGQLMLMGAKQQTPQLSALNVAINAARSGDGVNPVFHWIDQLPGSNVSKQISALEAQRNQLIQSGGGYSVSPTGQKTYIDRVLDTIGVGSDYTQLYQGAAGLASTRAGMAVTSGRGAAGYRSAIRGSLTNLSSAYGNIAGVIATLQDAQQRATNPDDKRALQLVIDAAKAQQLGAANEALGERATGFRMGLSEEEAGFGSVNARLGTESQRYLLSGRSVNQEGDVYRWRRTLLQSRARRLAGLAADRSNYLTPEDRQSYLAQAAQLRVEATLGLENERSTRRLGETQQASAVNMSALGAFGAVAQIGGGPGEQLAAANAKIREQVSLRHDLEHLLQTGTFTLEQQRNIQDQINRSVESEITSRKQAVDATISGIRAINQAHASSLGAQASGMTLYGGTSNASFGLTQGSANASMQDLATLKWARDHATSPEEYAKLDAQYQQARTGVDQAAITQFGSVSMSPNWQLQMLRLRGRLSRQQRSPYEGGSVLDTGAKVSSLLGQQMRAIQAQRDRDRRAGKLYAPVEANLEGQEEDVRGQQFDMQQFLDVGWIDRLVAMSVGSPSFASRLMPGSDRVAAIAQLRGLGRMSARVFGSFDQSGVRAADLQQFMPSDVSRFAFGYRPGDHPGTDISSDLASDGGALTPGRPSDAVEQGLVAPGPAKVMSELTGSIDALRFVLEHGLRIQIEQMNPTTGQKASTVTNAKTMSDGSDIMRGGSSKPGWK